MNPNLFARLENGSGYARTNQKNVLNPYVNFNNYKPTQQLYDMMVAESIQMRGVECFYLEREYNNLDLLFGEDLESKFTKAWKFAAYLNTYDSYEGQGTFYSKYSVQSNDEITLSINPSLFKHQVNDKEPKPGDLIYFKMDNSLFEITWVEPYNPFYQVGQNAIRKIIAQKFIYSGEELSPVLQHKDMDETYDQLDLEPITNLDGLSDIDISEVKEKDQVKKEASAFVDPFEVINGANDYFSRFNLNK